MPSFSVTLLLSILCLFRYEKNIQKLYDNLAMALIYLVINSIKQAINLCLLKDESLRILFSNHDGTFTANIGRLTD